MRITLTILLLCCFEISFTQSKTSSQKDNSIDTNLAHYDTLRFQTDTINITTQTKIVENVIVLDKKNNESDYLAVILSIFYILLGIGINKLLDYLKDKREIKQSGNRWISEIRCLEQPIKNQIKALENFRVEMQKEITEYSQMPFYSILNCEVFKTLDKNGLIKFIQMKHKNYNVAILKSNSIHGFISILVNLYDGLMKKANTFQQDYDSLMNSLNENIDEILREFGDYGVALEKKLQNDPVNDYRYKPLAEILFRYIEERPDNIFLIEKNYFLPLLECLSHLRLEPDLKNMTESVVRVLHIIKKLKTKRKQIDFDTEAFIKEYKEQVEELEKVIKPIEL